MDDLIKSLDLWAQTDSPERAALFARAKDVILRLRSRVTELEHELSDAKTWLK